LRRTGRAILQALIAAAGLGMLMLLFAVTSAPNLFDPMIGKPEGGFPYLMKQVLGESMGRVFIAASIVAIFVCTLAVQANTARVLFAMARDKSVPWASWLGRVDPKTQSPQKAALVIGVIAGGLLLFNMNNDKLMTALICVSIVWANLAYLFTTAPLFVRRWSNRKRHERSPARSWVFLAVNGLAVIWGVILLTNIGWPRESLYGEEWYMKYAAPLFTAGLLGIGVLVHQQLKVLHARGETV
jgi:amino acid transporter